MRIQDFPICSRSELDDFVKNELLPRWQKGQPSLFRVEPEHVESRIENIVESIIANNGTYEAGDRVVLNSRPDALALAVEMGYQLEKLGYQTCIIYSLLGNVALLGRLLKCLSDKKSLETLISQYEILVDFAQHWVVPYATQRSEPKKTERGDVKAFTEVVNKGLAELDEKRERGVIKSHDVVGFPVAHEAKRLGLSLHEWESALYGAMGVTNYELESEIEKTGYVEVLGEAYRGKTLRIVRKGNYPVDLSMKLLNRPIFKDVGKVGQNAIFGNYFERITNIPPGELFAAPVEDSVNGEFFTKIPQVTELGTMEGVHVIFRNGRVTEATATKGEEVLRYFTGLERPETEGKKLVYEAQNTIAELGIGINPVLEFEKTTGNPLIDEKMKGIHIATGTNKMMGGIIPAAIGGIAVEHWDFIVGKIDEIIAI